MSISTDNHYQSLGLANGAPPWQVEVAVERLSEQAANLVYESPQRSHELWERIRKIKEDLLSGDERREAYNRHLQTQEHSDESTEIRAASLSTAFRESNPSRRPFQQRTLPRSLVAAFVVALLIPVAAALLSRSSNSHKKATLPVVSLSNTGKVSHGGFVSGQVATLQWTKVRQADKYRLQIAAVATDPKDAVVFAHPFRTTTTRSAQYSLPVVGKQIYYWRVQAHMGRLWLPYTRSQHFLVNQPGAGTPTLLIPKNGAILFNKRLTLCWSSVTGSADYLLSVEGMQTKTVRARCSSIPIRVGQYGWKVAAQVRGVKIYTASYSRMSIFKILLRAKPNKRRPVVALRQTKPAPRAVAFNFRSRTGAATSSTAGGTPSRARSLASNSSTGSANRGSHSSLRNRKGPSGTHHVARPTLPKTTPGTVHAPVPPTLVPVKQPPPAVASQPTPVVYVVVVPTPVRQTTTKVPVTRSRSPNPVTYVQPPTARGTVVVASGRTGTSFNRPGSVPGPSTQPTPVRKHGHCKRGNCSGDAADGDRD